tara:strand:- start:3955 stop:5391 length:1437 start_codon:yes stop_codon:yes gene_type:complete
MRVYSLANRFKKTAIAAVCSSVLLLPYADDVRASGLQTQMDRIFMGMTHTTPPGVWESQRRGVISGGRVTTKNPIMTESIVRVTPPSWQAGCGGVDMHMGSFSFVNSDQMVQMLRAIAANAQGYAFQLALDTVYPQGAKWIENFQKVVRAMNSSMLNSCEAGQGVVNDTINALGFENHIRGMSEATTTGLVDGFFDSFSERAGESTGKALEDINSPRTVATQGNIVWKELRRNAAHSWFPGGDLAFMETILSISGSTVVGKYNDDGEQDINSLASNIITLEDLLLQGNIQVYDCSGDPDNCAIEDGDLKTISDFVGFQELFRRMLLGHDGSGGVTASPGIIPKMAANMGALTNEERDFMASLPDSMASMLRNLVVANPGAASSFISRYMSTLSLFMAYQLATKMIDSAITVVNNSDNTWAPQTTSNLMHARSRLDADYRGLLLITPSMDAIMQDYNQTLEAIGLNRYVLQDMSAQRAQ